MLENCKKDLIKKMTEQMRLEFVLVFGSYAKETEHSHSDLDIAYYARDTYTDYERFLIAGKLSSIFNVEVDLIDLKKVDTVLAAQIYFTGKLLYSRDDQFFFKERMKACAMYVTLNEQRKEVLQNIEARGTVYEE